MDDFAKHLLDNDFGQCCYRGGGGGRGFASQKEEEEEEGRSGEHGLSGGELFLHKKEKQKKNKTNPLRSSVLIEQSSKKTSKHSKLV